VETSELRARPFNSLLLSKKIKDQKKVKIS